ncbi:MAG: peptide deformylase [Candidatus Westeberhardia cardiocondylae]|nr:peptide deformylase [Candidatus Westeberhardia cardiocondylae]
MSLLKIIYYPDKRLRKTAKPIKKINKNIIHTIQNMFDTMYFFSGIGLAATQVNIHKQIIVIDISKTKNQKLVLINPIILNKHGNIQTQEGCLSIPEKYGIIPRYKTIKIRAFNQQGEYFELQTQNLLSICIQHEMDHLIGKLFIDYLK